MDLLFAASDMNPGVNVYYSLTDPPASPLRCATMRIIVPALGCCICSLGLLLLAFGLLAFSCA